MDALDRAGRKVGRDVAVMGIDNLPVTRLTRIGLTSIGQPHADAASRATEALLESVGREELPTLRLTLPPELIVRDSTCRSRERK